MEHNGVTSKAKEVAEKEVFSRVVTLEQAKEAYKKWIEHGLEIGGFEEKTIDFWKEVSNQVDKINKGENEQLLAENAKLKSVLEVARRYAIVGYEESAACRIIASEIQKEIPANYSQTGPVFRAEKAE